jgi:hypothetical protein
MGRQKCLLNAMLQQLSPATVVLRVQDIASAGKRLLETDIPAKELDTFVDLALKARNQPISSVSFVPPKVQTYDPDFDVVRSMVEEALAKADGSYQPPEIDGKRKPARTAGARNSSDDLARAC